MPTSVGIFRTVNFVFDNVVDSTQGKETTTNVSSCHLFDEMTANFFSDHIACSTATPLSDMAPEDRTYSEPNLPFVELTNPRC